MLVPIQHYLVVFEEPETETASGIALPKPDYWKPCQGTVVGLPAILPEEPLQAGRGDSIICAPEKVCWHDFPREGFVKDEDLLAIQVEEPGDAGFDWQTYPARGWVAICQDQDFDQVAEGVAVRETKSGVLVARGDRVPGAEVKLRRRGEELYRELVDLGYNPKLLEQPSEYYRHRVVWDFLDGLTGDERSALGEAIRRKGDLESGTSLGVYWRGSGAKSGTVLAVGALVDTPRPGERIVFDKLFRGYRFGDYLFVKADAVGAVVQSADNEHYELLSIS